MGAFTYPVKLFFTIVSFTVFGSGFAKGVGGSAEGVVPQVKAHSVEKAKVEQVRALCPHRLRDGMAAAVQKEAR